MGFASCKPADALVTGSIVRSATHWYLIYSEAVLRFFAPQGRYFAPIGVTFGAEEGTLVPFSPPNFTPIGAKAMVKEPQN